VTVYKKEREGKRRREKKERGRIRHTERETKLARVPAPRVFPREPNSLLQANIIIDHRSQITEKRDITSEHHNRSQITDHKRENKRKKGKERKDEREHVGKEKERRREKQKGEKKI